jgi:hypothetical protein
LCNSSIYVQKEKVKFKNSEQGERDRRAGGRNDPNNVYTYEYMNKEKKLRTANHRGSHLESQLLRVITH